ncbi:MAG: metal ABC transporter solute-binding protein, Zn/Mn family [Tumebacillaceae bacterium]
MKRWMTTTAMAGMGLSLLMATGCSFSSTEPTATTTKTVSDGQKVKVVTVLAAQTDFVKEIAKDKVEVKTLLPLGVNFWQYAPTIAEIKGIESADMFVLNGGGVEKRWYDQVIADIKLKAPNETVVDPSQGIKTMQLLKYINPDDPVEAKKEHVDPYMYLDPQNAKQEVDTITAALSKVAPSYADEFKKNATAYKQKLDALDKQYKDTLATVKHKELVSPYPAYQYLTARYGLKYYVPNTFTWNKIPWDNKPALEDLKADLKKHDLKAVYFHTEAAPFVVATLGEAGYKSGIIDPYEGAQDEQKYNSYLATMAHNLDALKTGLNL